MNHQNSTWSADKEARPLVLSEAEEFLMRNEDDIKLALEVSGHEELASEFGAQTKTYPLAPSQLSNLGGLVERMLSRLASAPASLESPHQACPADLDAAVRWLGARLEDLSTRIHRALGG